MSFTGCSGITISGGAVNHVQGNQNTTYTTTTTNNYDSYNKTRTNSYRTKNFGDDCMTFNGGRTTIITENKRKNKNRFPQNISYDQSIPIPNYGPPHSLPYQQRPLPSFEADEDPRWNQNQYNSQPYMDPSNGNWNSTPNLHPNMTSPAPYPSPPNSAPPPPTASYQHAQAPFETYHQHPTGTHQRTRSQSPPQMQHYPSNGHDRQEWSNHNPNARYDPNPNHDWSSPEPSRSLPSERYPYSQQYQQRQQLPQQQQQHPSQYLSPHPTSSSPRQNPNSNQGSQSGIYPQASVHSRSASSDGGNVPLQQSGPQSRSPPQRNNANNPFWRMMMAENGGTGAGANEGVSGAYGGGAAPSGAYGAYGAMNGEGRRGLPSEEDGEGDYKEDEEEEGKVKKVKKREF